MLNTEQQELFVRAAIEIARADGAHTPYEEALLAHIARETGFLLEATPEDWATAKERIPRAFANQAPAARAFLMELAAVAVVDGAHDPREHELLVEVGESLAVPAAAVDRFLDFYGRLQAIYAEGQTLVTYSSLPTRT